ncbi:MAG: hypothetical protein LBK56_01565 [Gracilibacteraceae bacterium]|jgi:hypothetical protein|nr:hypothetical protein [Gracilibacteraceae bacterium]
MQNEMRGKGYSFQIKKKLVQPMVLFMVLYPALLLPFYNLSKLPARYGQIFMVIYFVTLIALAVTLVFAKSQKLLIESGTLTFSSLLSREILEPADIRRVVCRRRRGWRRDESVIRLRADNKTYLLPADFYAPFDELVQDLKEWSRRHQVKYNFDEYEKI